MPNGQQQSKITDLSTDEQLLIRLLEDHPERTQEIILPMAELAQDQEEFADEVCNILKGVVAGELSSKCTEKVTQAILELLPKWADELAPVENDLIDVAGGDLAVRTRTYLTVHTEQVSTHKVAAEIAEILGKDRMSSELALIWALTKLGLDDPDAITASRRALVDSLSAPQQDSEKSEGLSKLFGDGTDGSEHSRRKQLYAAEALAINATGHVETATHKPSADPFHSAPWNKTAAWGIQTCVKEEDLEFDELDLHRDSKQIKHHGIAEQLVDPLWERAQNTYSDIAVASILALGYMGPNDDQRNEVRQLLSEISGEDTERGDAATWVLNDPRLPIYQDDMLVE